ncbi:AraC family transcriptional regulator [Hymenobacter algoricola]|uniref:AraC family transcriptional regulator n=1 Tax=Hymenobacter algoricola TaxID=486267 RepID=A0ABP7NSD5_9BACT
MASVNTVSMGSVNLLLWAAAQKGADQAALCRSIGLDPRRLQTPDDRLPLADLHRLWPLAVAASGDPHLDLHLGEKVSPVAYGVLAYVMMHSPTIEKALEQLCRYQDIVCDGTRTSLRRHATQVELVVELISPDITWPAYALNAELSAYLAALRLLSGLPLQPRVVRFAYPPPADVREHERIFGPAPVVFGAADTALVFEASVLALPVLNANPVLFAVVEQHAEQLVAQLQQPDLPGLVKREIVRLLKGADPALSTVADRLNLGVRTLQLHLKEAGLTYRQLLDEVRCELAQRHLRELHLSTTDIAFLLGYSEPSVFARSFKKWTGQTPGGFRKQVA